VLNLHGDANTVKLAKQFAFLRKISNVMVVFPETEADLKSAKFNETDPPVIVLHNFDYDVKQCMSNCPSDRYKYGRRMVADLEYLSVRMKIAKWIKAVPRPWRSIEQIAETDWNDFYVDFKSQKLLEAKNKAENLFGDMVVYCKT
jgi:hypothetical protein